MPRLIKTKPSRFVREVDSFVIVTTSGGLFTFILPRFIARIIAYLKEKVNICLQNSFLYYRLGLYLGEYRNGTK